MEPVESAIGRVFAIIELTESILLFAHDLLSHPKGKSIRRVRFYTAYDIGITASPTGDKFGQKHDISVLESRTHGMRWLLCDALRVNRFWNAVINSSAAIQEVLFLQWKGERDSTPPAPTFNPLLATKFNWGYFHIGKRASSPWWEGCRESAAYRDLSWRRMFPVLPPVRRVEVCQKILEESEDRYRKGRILLDELPENDGLRMGVLFDVAEWKESVTPTRFEIAWFGLVDQDKWRPNEDSNPELLALQHFYWTEGERMVCEFADASAELTIGHHYGWQYALVPTEFVTNVKITLTKDSALLPERRLDGNSYSKFESDGKQWGSRHVEWSE